MIEGLSFPQSVSGDPGFPVKTGIQFFVWIPAFAGMTNLLWFPDRSRGQVCQIIAGFRRKLTALLKGRPRKTK
jgi:hypothetical protein